MSGADRQGGVLVGRVVGVFGLRGDVKVAASVFELAPGVGVTAHLAMGGEQMLRVETVRPARGHVRVKFAGIGDATAAERLRGAHLRVAESELPPLPPQAYRESELVGMHVVDARLGALGDVVGIAHYPASDMLVVGDKRVLIPMLEAYGMHVDRASRTIGTELPPGFEDLM